MALWVFAQGEALSSLMWELVGWVVVVAAVLVFLKVMADAFRDDGEND